MPLIYTARCSTCGDRFGAVDRGLAVQLDDGSLLRLPHPCESDALAAAGFTWKQAQDQARLVRCEGLVCKCCGGLYERRRFLRPQGCLSSILFVLSMALLGPPLAWVVFARDHRPDAHSTIVVLALVALAVTAAWLINRWEIRTWRRHRPGRLPLSDKPCCADATPGSLMKLGTIGCWLRRFPCAACGGKTVTVRVTAIS